MSINYAQGSGNDWSVANTWSGGIPDATDTVVFNGSSPSLTVNVDRDSDNGNAGLDVVGLILEDQYNKQLGSQGTPVKLAAGFVIIRSTGSVWLEASMGTGNAEIDDLVIDSASKNVITISDDSSQVITRLVILNGNVVISAEGVIPSLEILGGKVTINTSSNAITKMWVSGNNTRVNCNRSVGDYEQTGGYCTQAIGAFSGTVISGGTLRYDSTSTMAGRTIVKNGGVLDLQQLRALTVTNMHKHPGGKVLKPMDNSLITYTKEFLYGQPAVN